LVERLIVRARALYAQEQPVLGLDTSVYVLDSTTIDLCLSAFPWAHFRSAKAPVKMHTLLDLRGSIPSVIHISDGKLHDVHVLDLLAPEPGAIYVMDRGYVDFARLYTLHVAGAFFVTRAKSTMDFHRVYSAKTDRSAGTLQAPLAGGTVLQMDQAASANQAFLRHVTDAVKTQIWIAVSVYVLAAIVRKRLGIDASLYTLLQILSVTLFEKMPLQQAFSSHEYSFNRTAHGNQLNLLMF
jgi:hypothetical protein